MKKLQKILITGAGGYIGSVATYLLLKKGFEVVAIDNFSTGYREPFVFFENTFGSKKFRYYDRDLKDPLDSIFEREKGIDAVLHYAAHCIVDESMKNPEKYFSNNVCGSQNLLSTMLQYKVNKLVFSSTCTVYGEAQYVPIDEKHPLNPANPYGASKKIVEEMMGWYGKLRGLKYVILRYFNVCGASDDGIIGDSKKPSTLLVQNAVRGALGIETFNLTCPKVDTKDGTPIRDYTNVVDLNEAHFKAIEYLSKGGKSDIINLGTGTGNSVLEVVETVQKLTKKKFKIGRAEPREGEYATMIADITKAKKTLSWSPKRGLKDSVDSLVNWYKKYPNGWTS